MDAIADMIGLAFRSGLFLIGITMGYFLGRAHAVMRRAWIDYRTVRKSVPGLRKSAIGTVPRVVKWWAIAGVGVIVAIAGMTAANGDQAPTVPAGVPSPAPPSSASPR